MWENIEWATLALVPGFIVFDLVYRARHYETIRFWRVRASLVTIAAFYLSMEVAAWWGRMLGDFHLLDSSSLGIAGGSAVGILVYEFIHYWYHRAAHQWNWLWRAAHQMHHSAESVDAFGAYYLSPLDVFMFTTLGSLVFYPLLGLVPEAGIIGAAFLTFNAMFQHANIRTPHWLGYLIQRPESHCIHHGRDIHRYNYSDLPLWDLVFGTFRNPTSVEGLKAGFYKGASSRIAEMLAGKDVSSPAGRYIPGTATRILSR